MGRVRLCLLDILELPTIIFSMMEVPKYNISLTKQRSR